MLGVVGRGYSLPTTDGCGLLAGDKVKWGSNGISCKASG